MGVIHQLSEQRDIVVLQCLHRLDRSLVLIYGMFCALSTHRTCDGILILLKLRFCQIAERVDLYHFLQFGKCRLTLAASLVVFGIAESALFVTAGDHNLRILEPDRRILIL